MKRHKTVSVVIPALNEAEHIRMCIEAVKKQTYGVSEIIVVDNGSDDDTAKIAQYFSGVMVMNEQKRGTGHARNHGFNAAKSDVIARIDADSILEPTWVEAMIKFMADHELDAASSYVKLKDPVSRLIRFFFNAYIFRANHLASNKVMLFGSSTMLTKTAWHGSKEDTSTANDIWEDLDLALALDRNDFKAGVLRKPLITVDPRRLQNSLKTLAHYYLIMWPKTYWRFKKSAAVLCVIFTLLSVPGFVIYRLMLNRHYD